MSAARITLAERVPPATDTSVANAYHALKALMTPGFDYEVKWEPSATGRGIIQGDPPEAWLVATSPGEPEINLVYALEVTGNEMDLRHELEALKAEVA